MRSITEEEMKILIRGGLREGSEIFFYLVGESEKHTFLGTIKSAYKNESLGSAFVVFVSENPGTLFKSGAITSNEVDELKTALKNGIKLMGASKNENLEMLAGFNADRNQFYGDENVLLFFDLERCT